jgi:hypothetical protein
MHSGGWLEFVGAPKGQETTTISRHTLGSPSSLCSPDSLCSRDSLCNHDIPATKQPLRLSELARLRDRQSGKR